MKEKNNLFKERIEKDFGDIYVSGVQDRTWWKATKKWFVFAFLFGILMFCITSLLIAKEKRHCARIISEGLDFDFNTFVMCENLGYDVNRDGILPEFYNNLNFKNLKVIEDIK